MILGLILTIALIIGIGILSGRKAKDAESFTTGGGRASGWVVCGAIMGTIVSGQSTVGTAQLAFSFGISAWWFTVGAAIGCLMLAVMYAKPLRDTGCSTLLEIVAREYGHKAEVVGSTLCLIGIFISIVAQIIASSALLTTLLPIRYLWAALAAVALMMIYVVFGGLWGAGLGGIVKMALLYISSIVAGVFVWRHSDGLSGLLHSIESIFANIPLQEGTAPEEVISSRYANIFARGPLKDLGGCLSLALGVLATQTYAQGIWAGRSLGASRRGGILCACLIPPIGAACTLVGMYMRAHYITAAELEQIGGILPEGMGVMQSSVQAFPLFITHHLPPFFGGVVLGTLFVTIVGGGSGLALGCASIINRDILAPLRKKKSQSLRQLRVIIVVLLLIAVAISLLVAKSFINDLGFLSLGLRATAVLIPLTCALFFPQRINRRFALASMISGTAALLAAQMLNLPADSFYWGFGTGLAVCLMGWRRKSLVPEAIKEPKLR